MCVSGGAGLSSFPFCKAELDLQQSSKSLQTGQPVFLGIMLDRKAGDINLKNRKMGLEIAQPISFLHLH